MEEGCDGFGVTLPSRLVKGIDFLIEGYLSISLGHRSSRNHEDDANHEKGRSHSPCTSDQLASVTPWPSAASPRTP